MAPQATALQEVGLPSARDATREARDARREARDARAPIPLVALEPDVTGVGERLVGAVDAVVRRLASRVERALTGLEIGRLLFGVPQPAPELLPAMAPAGHGEPLRAHPLGAGDASGEERDEERREEASEAREHAPPRAAVRASIARVELPRLRRTRAADRVRVATWNCFGVPGGLVGLLTGRPNLPERLRSATIARALASYDVICIQENFLDSVAEFVEDLADRLGMRIWHDRMLPEVLERSVFGAGLAILSAQPLDVRLRVFDVPACGMDMWASKGFATCELCTPSGARFRVVNLHLQADDPPERPSIYGPARKAQLRVVLDDLDRLAKIPTIVCGDLNVPEGSDEYRELLLPRMRAYGFAEVAEGMGLTTYSPSKNPLVKKYDPHALDMRVDYVWTRGGEGRRFRVDGAPKLLLEEPLDEREGLFASDHFGVGVELVLEDEDG